MAAGTGDGHGVQLEIAEPPDKAPGGLAGAERPSQRALGQPGPARFEQARAGQGQTAGGGYLDGRHMD